MGKVALKDKKYFYMGGKGSREGVRLASFELEMLAVLARQRYLTLRQIHLFHDHFETISINTLRNKLIRWTEKGLIASQPIPFTQASGKELNLYRMRGRGIELIIQEGYLSTEWKNRALGPYAFQKNYETKRQNHIDHYMGAQQVVIQTLLRLNQDRFQIESLFPENYPYINTRTKDETKLIIPDWILKHDNRIVNLEFDTGNHKHVTNYGKIEKYAQLAEEQPDIHHCVLFTLLDDSMLTVANYGSIRNRRLNNMMKSLLGLQRMHLPNLSVFVSSMKRANFTAERFLSSSALAKQKKKNFELEVMKTALGEVNKEFGYLFELIPDNDVYLSGTPSSLYADLVYRLTNKAGSHSDNVLVVFMEEGNVKTRDRLKYLYEKMRVREFKKDINKIITFYSQEEEMKRDIAGINLPGVLFGSNEHWKNHVNEDPVFNRIGRQNKWEAVSYEGYPVIT